MWLPGRRISAGRPPRARRIARNALHDHHAADDAEQCQIRDRDREIELPERAQQREQPDAGRGADEARRSAASWRASDRARAAANSLIAPENDDAATWLATLATATAGAMPTKINSGVIRNPPPIPEHARDESDREPHEEDQQHVDGEFGDRR